jgi:hypothetical protein
MLVPPATWRRSARQAESEWTVTEVDWDDALAYMLTQPVAELVRTQRRARFFFTGLAVLAALMYIASWLYAANRLWVAQQSGGWSWFWDAYKLHLGVVGIPLFVYFLGGLLTATIDQALAMRHAVEVSDATMAPIAPDQPLPLSANEMLKGQVRFVSLVRPEQSFARRQQITPAIYFFVFGSVCAGFAALFLALAGELAVLGPWFAIPIIVVIFVAMTLVCVAMGVLMLLRARRSLSPLNLTADEWGLAWDSARVRRRRMRIAWHEARAFFQTVPGLLAGATARTIYVLDAGDAVLAWALASSATPAERAASERLSRLIVTRTRLPLRSVALDLLHAVPTSDDLATERKQPDPASALTPPVSAWRILLLNPSCLGVLAVLALTGSLGALGWILERLRP